MTKRNQPRAVRPLTNNPEKMGGRESFRNRWGTALGLLSIVIFSLALGCDGDATPPYSGREEGASGALRVAQVWQLPAEPGSLTVWDLTGLPEAPVRVGGGEDEEVPLSHRRVSAGATLLHSEMLRRVFVTHSGDGVIRALDPDTGMILGSRELCPGFGSLVEIHGTGRLAGLCPLSGEIRLLDGVTLEDVDKLWVCHSPGHLARDAKGQRLFVSCPEERALVLVLNGEVGGPPTWRGGLLLQDAETGELEVRSLEGFLRWRSTEGSKPMGRWTPVLQSTTLIRAFTSGRQDNASGSQEGASVLLERVDIVTGGVDHTWLGADPGCGENAPLGDADSGEVEGPLEIHDMTFTAGGRWLLMALPDEQGILAVENWRWREDEGCSTSTSVRSQQDIFYLKTGVGYDTLVAAQGQTAAVAFGYDDHKQTVEALGPELNVLWSVVLSR